MPAYEQKLAEFAQGKRLLRLARPIRDRADAFCDACGSTQPRTLYALEDLDSERHYFVGDTCLKELAKRGAILRYGRHSGRVAFEKEMKLRAQEFQADGGTNADEAHTQSRVSRSPPLSPLHPTLATMPNVSFLASWLSRLWRDTKPLHPRFPRATVISAGVTPKSPGTTKCGAKGEKGVWSWRRRKWTVSMPLGNAFTGLGRRPVPAARQWDS